MIISLRAARINAGLTQEQAAELIGVIRITVSDWEIGKYKPKKVRRQRIAETYGLTEAQIDWEGKDDEVKRIDR